MISVILSYRIVQFIVKKGFDFCADFFLRSLLFLS
jgi:hypothetical protein